MFFKVDPLLTCHSLFAPQSKFTVQVLQDIVERMALCVRMVRNPSCFPRLAIIAIDLCRTKLAVEDFSSVQKAANNIKSNVLRVGGTLDGRTKLTSSSSTTTYNLDLIPGARSRTRHLLASSYGGAILASV
jgi:hypothetical protein